MADESNIPAAKAERRQYFRVEDVLPVVVRKMVNDCTCVKARVFRGYSMGIGVPVIPEETPEEGVHPAVWKMLVDISNKLNLVLDKLYLDGEGLCMAESRQISISASGLRITMRETFELGDFIEAKLLLPITVPTWVVVYGKVSRLQPLASGEFDIAIEFADMEDDVRDVINYYTLTRQREIIMKQRGYHN